MSDINIIMINWCIPSRIVPINLGYSGENNALSISIKMDNKIDFDTVKYYLDIMDMVDGEKAIVTTQELEFVEDTEDEVTSYFLKIRPSSEWLGKEGLKYLQVRCTYIDDTDTENPKNVIIKSNPFTGIVRLGLYH